MADSYVCSGAIMQCTMGTAISKLKVSPIRTVFLCGKPQANIGDHLPNVNIPSFGLCRSLGYPPTESATAAASGVLTPTACNPGTYSKWYSGKKDYCLQEKYALLKSSKCRCIYGGTISLVTDGQSGEGAQWVSKLKQEEFDKDQVSTEGLSAEKVLDGIQMALDAAGFIPGLGAIPDLTNAAISALRGNWGEAGLSLLAAIPGIGDVAAGVKLAKKGMKVAKSMDKAANGLVQATKGLSKYEKKALLVKEAKNYTGKNITAKELVAHGMSKEDAKFFIKRVRNERRDMAKDFYKNYTKWDDAKIESHLSGINYNKPISIDVLPPKGQKNVTVYQYRSISINTGEFNKSGNYFTTDSLASPKDLGIADIGVAMDETVSGVAKGQLPLPFQKERFMGTITEEIPCLRSTAKGVNDTWSVPGQSIYAKGGGEQLFIPNNSFASEMIKN